MPRSPQFGQRVLSLLAAGRNVGQVAAELRIGAATLYRCKVKSGSMLVKYRDRRLRRLLDCPMPNGESEYSKQNP